MTNVEESSQENSNILFENPKLVSLKNLVRLALLGLLGVLFLSLSSLWIAKIFHVDIQQIMTGKLKKGNNNELSALQLILILNSFLAFILPAFIYNAVSDKIFLFRYFGVEKRQRQFGNFFWATGIFLSAIPLVMYVAWLNQLIPLPDWANETESNVAGMVKTLLSDATLGGLLSNLFIMAFLPALGEEWFFRGSLQRIFIQRFGIKKYWQAILLTGFLFSALHFQFEGFLPRFVLGLILGYIFYKTGNIWISVFLHFLFNGAQIVLAFFIRNEIDQINSDKMESPPWYGVLVCSILLYYFYKQSPVTNPKTDEQI
jgi:membrane protease YdiL (CAAX protease family)